MTKKTIKVILTKSINNLGEHGTIIKAKPGYIRNYLIPKKFAKMATHNVIHQFELEQKAIDMKKKQFLKECNDNKELLENLGKFTIYKKIKEDGIFFGKITKKQILDLLNEKVKLTTEINKTQLEFPEMKRLGNYIIKIILTNNIIAKINIDILAE
uniref:50S ribosomal protein L9, chloroplastic n=2 Tax=Fucus TaxID=3011 RepID=A0A2R4QQ28_9PHAE|nr:50S ribosomal protein L9 [Fucus vesiculosus]AVZ00635.1 50S ribosomal protein L9 [Fucus spiralis]CAX12501.1 50S ribosomal protein L9 [Fucus vesiculosus]